MKLQSGRTRRTRIHQTGYRTVTSGLHVTRSDIIINMLKRLITEPQGQNRTKTKEKNIQYLHI